ncbi:hypothetical protein RCO28_31705 [Streptomyces sp. LHD-70]|uniref:hypothetical protein n=1 Tax=Streptomyces sp. LHD-70 TaxID=3072140 RepID=UPI00280DEDBE|nr:hypothetical protein [Streptomyces sp. LHD-70]MDQ8707005.1 hypothetical protein [Streptomyces sp. LHD-70]
MREAESLTVEADPAGGEGCPGRPVQFRFRTPFDARAVPESVKGRSLWLSWQPPSRRKGADAEFRSPAVLVFDSGLVVHGMLSGTEAEPREAGGAGAVATTEARALQLWDPGAFRAALVSRFALGLGGTAVLGAAVLTYEIPDMLRWVVGAVTMLCGLALPGELTRAPAEGESSGARAPAGTP